jgi:phage recombination protein Bet
MNSVVPLQAVEVQRPRDYSASQLALVKRTVAADCNDDEFNLFVEVCKRVGLDPFRKQIHAVVYSKDKPNKRKMSIITGIDGFRAVAARNGDYRPDDEEPAITYLPELKDPMTNPLGIEKAVVKCYKLGPDKQWHAIPGVAYWDEFAPMTDEWAWNQAEGKKTPTGKRELSGKWKTMPRVMIVKCSEAAALRKGWPEDLSGIYAAEEMDRAQIDGTASEAIEEFEKEQRLRLTNAKEAIAMWWKAGDPLDMVPLGQIYDRSCRFLAECRSAIEIETWQRTNQVSLQAFWANSKSDALGLKKAIEKRLAELDKPE